MLIFLFCFVLFFLVVWYIVAIKEEEVMKQCLLFFCKFFAFKSAQLNDVWIMSVVLIFIKLC